LGPGPLFLLGILIVNLINNDWVHGEDGSGDSRAVCRVRLIFFIALLSWQAGEKRLARQGQKP
jgi:hypothetical protein